MIIEIDQSGKVEETAKDTVVAFVDNSKKKLYRSILLPKKEKRKLQRFFRDVGMPRRYNYQVFSALIFLLIRPYLRRLDRVIVDIEYPGQNTLIRNLILEKVRPIYEKFDPSIIVFQRIGKGSPAHDRAYYTYQKKYKPNQKIGSKDVLGAIIAPE
ncbi:MAG: hypothetical protein Q8P73_05240 [bacterium]|nr:hypothetical protein [bacterium]